ncbi:diacylglycerol kinase delta-like isoform X1, partial [Tachysurus ichikawai]
MAAAAAVAEGARALDESSDSDAEHEPGAPQKLIRKVSTSGQIRSKVGSRRSEMRLRFNDRYHGDPAGRRSLGLSFVLTA